MAPGLATEPSQMGMAGLTASEQRGKRGGATRAEEAE